MEEVLAQINGRTVRYVKIGDKGPLVFILHGWPANLETWRKAGAEVTKAGFQVILPDWPGFGQSQEPHAAWGVQDYTAWLKVFLEEVNTRYQPQNTKYIIIGHSFGGRIAIRFAAKNPEFLNKLVLVSPAGIKKNHSPLWEKMNAIGNAFLSLPFICLFKPILRKAFYKFIIGSTDYINTRGVMRETFKKIVKEDLSPLLPLIKTPTLLIWGNRDEKTPLEDGIIMNSKIRNSKLEIIHGVGHSPNKEEPEIVAAKIIDFLNQP